MCQFTTVLSEGGSCTSTGICMNMLHVCHALGAANTPRYSVFVSYETLVVLLVGITLAARPHHAYKRVQQPLLHIPGLSAGDHDIIKSRCTRAHVTIKT